MNIKKITAAVVLAVCSCCCCVAVASHPMLDKVIARYNHNITWEQARKKIFAPKELFLVKKDGDWGVLRRSGEPVLPIEYSRIRRMKNNLLLLRKDGKTGISDYTGKILIPVRFDEVRPFPDGFFVVKEDGCFGVYNEAGVKILPAEYNKIIPRREHFIVEKNEKTGICALDGREILPCVYDKAYASGNGGYIAGSDAVYNYYDEERRLVSKNPFAEAAPFSEGMAAVRLQDLYGYIDENCEIKIQPAFSRAEKFSEGAAYVETSALNEEGELESKARFFIDERGNKIFDAPPGSYISGFDRGTAVFKQDGKFHFIDHEGREKFAIEAASVYKMDNGMISITRTRHNISLGGLLQSAFTMVVGIPGIPGVGKRFYDTVVKLGYYDAEGRELVTAKNDYNSAIIDDMIISIANDKAGFVRPDGSAVIPAEYDDVSDFDWDGTRTAVVKQNGQYGFYTAGMGVKLGGYYGADNFVNGLANVQVQENRWTYIDADGKSAALHAMQWATPFYGSYAVAKNISGRFCIIDRRACVKTLLDADMQEVEALQPDTALAKINDKWGVLDENGVWLLPAEFEKLEYL